MNFYLSNVLATSHKFWHTVSAFTVLKHFLNLFVVSPVLLGCLGVLSNFYLCVSFLDVE